MYNNFTERALRVMTLANRTALVMGSGVIDTHHVLIAMLKEGSGVATWALKEQGVTLERALSVVHLLFPEEKENFGDEGQLCHSSFTETLLAYAAEESGMRCQSYVGTEHLLLGTLRTPDSRACKVLQSLGVDLEKLKSSVIELMGKQAKKENLKTEEKAEMGLQAETFIISNKRGLDDMNVFFIKTGVDNIVQIEHVAVGENLYAVVYYNLKI